MHILVDNNEINIERLTDTGYLSFYNYFKQNHNSSDYIVNSIEFNSNKIDLNRVLLNVYSIVYKFRINIYFSIAFIYTENELTFDQEIQKRYMENLIEYLLSKKDLPFKS